MNVEGKLPCGREVGALIYSKSQSRKFFPLLGMSISLLSEYLIFPITTLMKDFRKGLLIITIIIIIIIIFLLYLTSIIESRNGNWFFFGDRGKITKLTFPLETS